MLSAVLIQVLVFVLTLAAASGAMPMASERFDSSAMVESDGSALVPSSRAYRLCATAPVAPRAACRSLTAGRVVGWIDQGRGPMPPPMA
ncbi:MAG: hypothetical protein FJ270_01215 [Planctomycetes bacterium]|nr:hypothetical protein [Planctomycetota bacterium]